jgi:monovalent cation:H+ antiporter-2, CPA2 family
VQLHVLQDLAVIFAVSVLVVLLFHRLRLPALPGFIVAGLVLGPNALRLVGDVHAVEALAEVGVILLLFTIGIEFSLARLREMARQVVGVGALQVGLTAGVAAVVALLLVSRWQVAVFLGLLVALSSTAIVLKLLTDRGEIDAPHGRIATSVLIFQDLCVVPIMLFVPFLAGTAHGGVAGVALALGKAAVIVAGVLVASRLVVPRLLQEILKTRSRELFLITIILLVTLTALGTAAAGASLALGAFLAGLVLSESDYGHQALAELLPFRDVFISLFFVTVGMLVDFTFLRQHPWLTIGGVAVVLGGKTALAAAAPILMGSAARVALLAGLAVAQIGEFSFVLAREGQTVGLLSGPVYQTFLAVAVCTMLLTPFLIQGGPAIVHGLERALPLRRLLPVGRPPGPEPAREELRDHVIIAGYGLNGRNLAAALRSVGVAYYIVELNAQTVRRARAQGEPAFYGDATREEILHALGVERARLFVVAISDPAATRRMVRVARSANQDLFIIARTRYVVEIPELSRLGADVVIPEEFETSVEIFARVLSHYRVPRQTVDQLTDEIRAAHYSALRTPAGSPTNLAAAVEGIPRMEVERLEVRAGSAAAGRSLAELELRTRTGALVLSLQRDGTDHPTPDPQLALLVGDVLVVVGQPAQVQAAREVMLGPSA